jgi:hypothetical protein
MPADVAALVNKLTDVLQEYLGILDFPYFLLCNRNPKCPTVVVETGRGVFPEAVREQLPAISTSGDANTEMVRVQDLLLDIGLLAEGVGGKLLCLSPCNQLAFHLCSAER